MDEYEIILASYPVSFFLYCRQKKAVLEGLGTRLRLS